ncbi:hypothetical protein [Histidinibacterium lentulum]|uniref:hypothetical protein n=1 Tax=Histidinibacterium lentulum TaxID=2480588 RepID=UPI000F4C0542|nr:hypothetical protein [Histidinibacterium lentulum]
MDIRSVEISRSFLERLRELGEEALESLPDRVRFEIAEGPLGDAAGAAPDDGRVGVMIINGEDGPAAVFTLKMDPEEISHG